MPDLLLWKRLFPNDFNAINGAAIAPGARGGGARHIVLGTEKPDNDVRRFLSPANGLEVKVPTQATGNAPPSELVFRGDPNRRGGEWLIADQKTHRHPAWSDAAGFPALFDVANPPVIMVFRTAAGYFPTFMLLSGFLTAAPDLASRERGVDLAPPLLLAMVGLMSQGDLVSFDCQRLEAPVEEFDPADAEDSRRRVFGEILRRQGQKAFRAELLERYEGRCAFTGCADRWVLEAAHITPYLGPATNKASNGLLLRADIHTLYDLGLIAIHPDSRRIHISQQIDAPEYKQLNGREPMWGRARPSQAAIRAHWSRFIG